MDLAATFNGRKTRCTTNMAPGTPIKRLRIMILPFNYGYLEHWKCQRKVLLRCRFQTGAELRNLRCHVIAGELLGDGFATVLA